MFRLRHPFSGHIYSALGDGRVGVEKDGQSGVFDRYGSWLSGDIRVADLEMCRWVGTHHAGAQMSRHSGSFPERSVAGGQDRTPLSKEIR